MRKQIDIFKTKTNLNFSLFAPAAEYVSGRFNDIDNKQFDSPLVNKGFYTNSFHVYVDSGITATEKIKNEGKFHPYCNGGCITYVELKEYPHDNKDALYSLLNYAQSNGIHYLGFNFPKDKCNNCGNEGVFDKCTKCGSKNIKRIRRVSGYLEITDYFTSGKKHEFVKRQDNE
jgi:ribonucleoside-triphosphate reductase